MRMLIFGYFLRSGFRHSDTPNSDVIPMVPVKEYLSNFMILAILNFVFVITFTVFSSCTITFAEHVDTFEGGDPVIPGSGSGNETP